MDHFAADAALAVAKEREGLIEPGGVIARHIHPGPVLFIECQALHGQKPGICPLLPPPAFVLAGKYLTGLRSLLPHPNRHRQPFILLARDVQDTWEPDLSYAVFCLE